MCKCKKCGNDFEVPKNVIEMVFATYCKPCIKNGLKKKAKQRKLRLFSVIHRFLCKVGLHNWKFERGVINKYYECKWCKRSLENM